MIFVGNDIINLKEAYSFKKDRNFSWINKVFNSNEKDFILQSENEALTLWKLWALKECAYKVFVKLDRKRFMNAKNIVIQCDNRSADVFNISYKTYSVFAKFNFTQQYVHSICASTQAALNQLTYGVFDFGNVSQLEGSKLIRKKLLEKLNLPVDTNLKFTKDDLGIPEILRVNHNKMFPIDISFSHDEPYFAYVFLRNELKQHIN